MQSFNKAQTTKKGLRFTGMLNFQSSFYTNVVYFRILIFVFGFYKTQIPNTGTKSFSCKRRPFFFL